MAAAFVILVWMVGAALNTYLYYRRRCGMPISLDSGSEGNPGIGSAVLLGAIWPISLFNQRFRQPERCTHPAHAEHWAKVEKVRMAAGLMRRECNVFRSSPAVWLSSRLLAATLVAAGLIAIPTSASAVGPFPDYTPPRTTAMTHCPSVAVVGFRGSGEAFDDGNLGLGGPINAMTAELRRKLPGVSIGTSAVSYPAVPWLIPFKLNSLWALYASASYTAAAVSANVLGNRYADSVATGANDGSSDITHLAVRCPTTKIVVSGYSQGGQALRAALRKLNNTAASHVSAIVFFGDAGFIPQEPGVSVIGDPQRQGKGIGVLNLGNAPLGSRFAGRVLSDCKDTDPICQASYSNLYTIGVHLTYGSSSDAFLVASWLKGTLYPPVSGSQPPCETFVADTTIPDGTVLAAGSTTNKTWTLRNCGSSPWSGVKAVRVSGSAGPASFSVPALAAGATGPVSMSLTVPTAPGSYRTTYQLSNSAGFSKGSFWVYFVVPASTSADCEAFVADITVPDGTTVHPGQTFDKTWRLRNCGRTNWSTLTAVRVSGNYGPASFAVPTTAPGATSDVTIPVTAPTQLGLSRATYRLRAPDGHYADNSFWVEVNVVAPAQNHQAVTSYDQMRPGAPHHGYFATAWQPFVAASNTITWISATVGNPASAAGATVPGSALTLRICIDPNCSVIVAEAHPQIVNYGETGTDIGDVAVTQGATYYLVWYQPSALNGSTWVTYWWGGGSTISTSDLMQAAARGYDR